MAAPQRESTQVSTGPCVEAFLSFLQAGTLGEVWGQGFSAEYSSTLQVYPFWAMVSSDWSVAGQGVFSHYSQSWSCPPGFAAFLGLELQYN